MPALIIVAIAAAAAAAAYLVWRLRWGRPLRSFPRVLAYHKVTTFEFGGTWVPPARFVKQIDALLGAGHRFIGEDAFLERLESPKEGSAKDLFLTFDDGYEEFLTHAAPALEKRGIPALVFLVSAFMGRDNLWELGLPGRRFRHLDWGAVRELAARGFRFGSHSRTHRDLTRLTPAAVCEEVVRSKAEIEDGLGRAVNCFSYPFGRADAVSMAEAASAGYRAAFTMYPDRRNEDVHPFELRREGVYIIDTVRNLRCKLGSGGSYWIEDLKGRAINGVAVLTPILKRSRTDRRPA